MSYYIRILSHNNKDISIDQLLRRLIAENMHAVFEVDYSDKNKKQWDQIIVRHSDKKSSKEQGNEIAILEKHIIYNNPYAQKQINRLINQIANSKPYSASKWLKKYLIKVKTLYAFQILDGINENNGWDILNELKNEIWETLRGIFQADGEGFSNTLGFQILWQFPDNNLTGKLPVAVLRWGAWTAFEMDLTDKNHKQAFLKGKVPKNTKKL